MKKDLERNGKDIPQVFRDIIAAFNEAIQATKQNTGIYNEDYLRKQPDDPAEVVFDYLQKLARNTDWQKRIQADHTALRFAPDWFWYRGENGSVISRALKENDY